MNAPLRILGGAHGRIVHARRVRVLAGAIANLLKPGQHVTDIGCGDGTLASLLTEAVPDLTVEGFEVLVREQTAIPVKPFDGKQLDAPDNSTDVTLLVDVLHHADDPVALLAEAQRISRQAVIIKDHRLSRPLAHPTLRFMDWVSNRPHGVVLPYNYWSEQKWRQTWQQLGLTVDHYQTRLGLYPWPASWLFETGLHILVRLLPCEPEPQP